MNWKMDIYKKQSHYPGRLDEEYNIGLTIKTLTLRTMRGEILESRNRTTSILFLVLVTEQDVRRRI